MAAEVLASYSSSNYLGRLVNYLFFQLGLSRVANNPEFYM